MDSPYLSPRPPTAILYGCEAGHVTTDRPADDPSWQGREPFCRYVLVNCEEVGCATGGHEPGSHMGRWCGKTVNAQVKAMTRVDVRALGITGPAPISRPLTEISLEVHVEMMLLPKQEAYEAMRAFALEGRGPNHWRIAADGFGGLKIEIAPG